MNTKIVEAHLGPLWLKLIIGTYEQHELAHCSNLPGYEHLNLIKHAGKAQPDDIWLLDLSTSEGATFNLSDDADHRAIKVQADI